MAAGLNFVSLNLTLAADALQARAVPIVFATGYDQVSIPARDAEVPRYKKAVRPPQIVRTLFC